MDVARRFTKDCHELGSPSTGRSSSACPGETGETIRENRLRQGDQSSHDPGVAGRALSGTFLYTRRWRTAGWTTPTPSSSTPTRSRSRRCTSPFEAFGDLPVGRGFYRGFYFRGPRSPRSSAKWLQPRNDEAAPAGRRRVLPLPKERREAPSEAAHRHGRRLRTGARGQQGGRAAHEEGVLTAASLMAGGAAVADAVRRARRMPRLRVGCTSP